MRKGSTHTHIHSCLGVLLSALQEGGMAPTTSCILCNNSTAPSAPGMILVESSIPRPTSCHPTSAPSFCHALCPLFQCCKSQQLWDPPGSFHPGQAGTGLFLTTSRDIFGNHRLGMKAGKWVSAKLQASEMEALPVGGTAGGSSPTAAVRAVGTQEGFFSPWHDMSNCSHGLYPPGTAILPHQREA